MNRTNQYIPIDCGFYDLLEADATLRKISSILIKTDSGKKEIKGRIKNIYARSGIEYLVLESGKEIRLDQILKFNGKSMPLNC